jgi:hypothetical protein
VKPTTAYLQNISTPRKGKGEIDTIPYTTGMYVGSTHLGTFWGKRRVGFLSRSFNIAWVASSTRVGLHSIIVSAEIY